MPPKGWKKYPDGFKPVNSSGAPLEERPVYGIQDLLLPRQSILKLAKEVLPEKTPLPKDGVTALLRSSTVFISYIAAEANRIADRSGRKIVGPADITAALEQLHMGAFVGQVQELVETMKKIQMEAKLKGTNTDADDEIDDDAAIPASVAESTAEPEPTSSQPEQPMEVDG